MQIGVNPDGPDGSSRSGACVLCDQTVGWWQLSSAMRATTRRSWQTTWSISGDYAGQAQVEIERATARHATAMFLMLCGGDQNLILEASRHTWSNTERKLAAEVIRLVQSKLAAIERIDLQRLTAFGS